MRHESRIRMEVLLSPDDPRDQAIIRLLRNVAPRRRVSKLKHLAYEGILARQSASASAPAAGQPALNSDEPVEVPNPVSTAVSAAPIEPEPLLVPASEFLEKVLRQGERFSQHTWDGQ